MNPNLLYAQAIKGRFTGRGIGIIDTIHLVEVGARVERARGGSAPCRRQSAMDVQQVVREIPFVDDDTPVRNQTNAKRRTTMAHAG